MHPLLQKQPLGIHTDLPMDKAIPSSPDMLRPYTPPQRSGLRSADESDMEPRPHSSPYSDYYTDPASSPYQESHYSKKSAKARSYLFSEGSTHSTARSSPPPFEPMPWTESAPLSANQIKLLSYIHNVDKWVSEHDPNEQQFKTLMSSFEVINATLTAPEPQTRQPAEELFDSGMFMSSEDGRTSACSTPSKSFMLHDNSCVPLYLVTNYTNEVMDLAGELSKRFDETKVLNQLALDRIKMHEDIIESLRKANEKQALNLHLDYSELVYLKMELNSIRSLTLPPHASIETFEDAIRHFGLNWRNTERRFTTRITDNQASAESSSSDNSDEEDGDREDADENGDEQQQQQETRPTFWSALNEALDGFAQALGMFVAFED
jgi:hypothetical protein